MLTSSSVPLKMLLTKDLAIKKHHFPLTTCSSSSGPKQPFLLFTTCFHFLAGGWALAGATQVHDFALLSIHPASALLRSALWVAWERGKQTNNNNKISIKLRIISNCVPWDTMKSIFAWNIAFWGMENCNVIYVYGTKMPRKLKKRQCKTLGHKVKWWMWLIHLCACKM